VSVAHVDDMAVRLPQLYRDGELARGLLGVAGVALEVLDEDRLSVQRSHWFDRCVERDHAARLAALLDIAPEPWQSLEQFRAWVHAFRDALVERGAVTRPAIQRFVEDYVAAFNAASGAEVIGDVVRWSDSPSPSGPAFVENPPRDRIERTPTTGGIEPLHQFELEHRGLEPSPASFLLVGLPEGPESVPVVVNLTTGRALLVLEQIRPGERLWLRSEGDAVTARLEGRDVSASLRSVAAVVPGQAWAQEDVQTPAHPLVLLPGVNRLWFLPVAHRDVRGLDRFLLALAAGDLREGRFDETPVDRSLFYLDPAVSLHAAWTEAEPAAFDVRLPAGALVHDAGGLDASRRDRDNLGGSLDGSVARLRAAGVRSRVTLDPFAERQFAQDALLSIQPLVQREIGPTGADSTPDAGGIFGVTEFDGSTFG
jgi:hypothetical protein